MKRLFLICVIALLFVSGWSHVLAAAICPNTQAMSSCPMQTESKLTSSHEVMGEMGDMQMPPTITEDEANTLEQPMGSCPHCFTQPEQQTTPVVASKGVEQSKRDLGIILHQKIKALAPRTSSFAPPILSRQHAPPQASAPRYVLISSFLI